MRRIPQGLRKIQKEELITQLSHPHNDKISTDVEVLESRIGEDWSNIDTENVTKQAIRW